MKTVHRIGHGSNEILELGDITVVKEWTFAKDISRGILMLVAQDEIFEAALGSGKGCPIEYWLEICLGVIGKDWKQFVRLREGCKAEYPILVSDPARFTD